jgi:gamma-butyrobetaine dioxygenase
VTGIDQLAALFAGPGARDYLGERVCMANHMLQAGALAIAAGAHDALVAAALLHDVGHLGIDSESGRAATDRQHADLGAGWLEQWFGPDVTEPIRLHVAAKRYLCAVEPAYFGKLSPASVHTLELQGGAMSSTEVAEFELLPYCADAISLRHWDELAKDADAEVLDFDDFRPLLTRLTFEP